MIKAENLSKSYGNNLVLDNITMQFPKGRITSLIGSNGAGKSTLLSIISRLLEQDDGTVAMDGKEISDFKNKQLARHLSILKQSNNVGLKLTVEELVSFGRFPYSQGRLKEEDHQKIEEAIQFLSLENIRNSYLDELSGGQKQRAYLAMVVAQDTDYILLDEPLNNLDMKYSVQIMTTLRKLADELGKTIIIVLHDINFASHYSDYIAALKDANVEYYGITNEIITEQILQDVFDIRCAVTENNGKKTCNYFNHNS
jgi:iron complex transport system ATP-binding protein